MPCGLIYQIASALRNRRMPNGTYGGVRGRKTKVGRKLLRFPPTRLYRFHTGNYKNMVSNRLSVNKLDYRPVRHLPEHIHAGSQMGKRYPVRGIMDRGQQTPPDIEDLDPFPFFQSVHIQIIIGGQKANLSVKPSAIPSLLGHGRGGEPSAASS